MMRKTKKTLLQQGGPRNLFIIVFVFLCGLLLITQLTEYTRHIKTIDYSEFLNYVEQGSVAAVRVNGQEVSGELKDGIRFETVIADNPANWELLKEHKVAVSVANNGSQFNLWYFMPFLFFLPMFLFGVWYFFRQSRGINGGGGSGSNIFTMGKSRARMFMPSSIKENFNSVAGAAEAKEELRDIIDFLRDPEKYKRLGAKVTRGVLLIGEPGNGKTLLAKAVAGEANCPFFTVSGSDFIEVFVGVGASRVRDLFIQARRRSPSIIFIDEIDAVGRHRGTGLGGGNDEREQTLNQLLTEMDGFQTDPGTVIVMAATNRPDVLDKALLRPGRFDRCIEVPYPTRQDRKQILQLHAAGVTIDPVVDLDKIARGTPGFTGADLANIINEAAIDATRKGQKNVTVGSFEEARDKITLGKESKSKVLSEYERKVTAYHEAGHALIRLLLPQHTDPLHKVTIIPRGRALGVTHWLPEGEKYTESKEEMEASIVSALGGRVAEEVVFKTLMTGAHSDFVVATKMAREMVCSYGMHDATGTVIYSQQPGSFRYAEETAFEIDKAVKSILDICYKKAKKIIEESRKQLDILAEALLEKETLYANEIYELLDIKSRVDHSFR